MPGVKSDESLRGKIRAVAHKYNLRPQEVLQIYLFEHLLMRLVKSDYADKFVLKGGLLIASMIGLARRTTMDMDTTVAGMPMDEESVTRAITEICAAPVQDDMDYSFERIEPIREDDEYVNWRAHIRVRYGRINAPIKIDITTGDVIVPARVVYEYPMMFEDGAIGINSYPIEMVLAEKFETVVRRGSANTRGRDFYDIYIFLCLRKSEIRMDRLRAALEATSKKRGSHEMMKNYARILEEVRASTAMRESWRTYIKSAPYTRELPFDDAIDAAIELGNLIYRA